VLDEAMKDEVKITVIATGFDKKNEASAIAAASAAGPVIAKSSPADAGSGNSHVPEAAALGEKAWNLKSEISNWTNRLSKLILITSDFGFEILASLRCFTKPV
jgi:cell division GTPase FtsZ